MLNINNTVFKYLYGNKLKLKNEIINNSKSYPDVKV